MLPSKDNPVIFTPEDVIWNVLKIESFPVVKNSKFLEFLSLPSIFPPSYPFI